MPPPDLVRSIAKLEDLPSDGGRAVDVLAGGLLRTFARLNAIERAYAELRARVAVIEDRARSHPVERPKPSAVDERRVRVQAAKSS